MAGCGSICLQWSASPPEASVPAPGRAGEGVFDYIEAFCNRNRRHGHLGGASPAAFEAASAGAPVCLRIQPVDEAELLVFGLSVNPPLE